MFFERLIYLINLNKLINFKKNSESTFEKVFLKKQF